MANGNVQAGVIATPQQSPSGQDPLRVMIEIVNDPNLAAEDKTQLIEFAKNRFRHRRRMAYTALWALILSLPALFIMFLLSPDEFEKIANSALVISIEVFLTTIVGAYYGVSAWRPAS